MNKNRLNPELSQYLKSLHHPLIKEIEHLRKLILNTHSGLAENTKWNGPNYLLNNIDRVTLKIHPPKLIQLVLHFGTNKNNQPTKRPITQNYSILEWRGNERAFISIQNMEELITHESEITEIVKTWLSA